MVFTSRVESVYAREQGKTMPDREVSPIVLRKGRMSDARSLTPGQPEVFQRGLISAWNERQRSGDELFVGMAEGEPALYAWVASKEAKVVAEISNFECGSVIVEWHLHPHPKEGTVDASALATLAEHLFDESDGQPVLVLASGDENVKRVLEGSGFNLLGTVTQTEILGLPIRSWRPASNARPAEHA